MREDLFSNIKMLAPKKARIKKFGYKGYTFEIKEECTGFSYTIHRLRKEVFVSRPNANTLEEAKKLSCEWIDMLIRVHGVN